MNLLEIFLGMHQITEEQQRKQEQEHQEYVRQLNERRNQSIAYYKKNKLENAMIQLR